MNNHEFANGDGYGDDRSQPCDCGKWWWHEEHFGGDKLKAVMAFGAFIKEERDQEGCRLAEPPRFFSVTEAEAWMAEQRRVRGIPEPEERLSFASQEEADDWLRQQAGEPYVPSKGLVTGARQQVHRRGVQLRSTSHGSQDGPVDPVRHADSARPSERLLH